MPIILVPPLGLLERMISGFEARAGRRGSGVDAIVVPAPPEQPAPPRHSPPPEDCLFDPAGRFNVATACGAMNEF
jgi:hypothetical protein